MIKMFLTATLFAFAANAQTTSTTMSVPATTSAEAAQGTSTLNTNLGGINKKYEEDKDVTDAKLRADAGSLSQFSLRFNLSYYGPTLGDLSAKDQPNPDGTIGTYETALSGSLGARYRFDSASSMSFGTGLKAIHPLHGMERTDMNDPYVSYDMLAKWGAIQVRQSPSVSYITTPNYKNVGEYGALKYDLSTVYNLGKSNYALGFDTSLGYFLYDRPWKKTDGRSAAYNIAFMPNAKYNFSDKLNVNTSINVSYWNARSNPDRYNLQNRTISQRLGIGYAYTRDIYLNPYINFFPSNARTEDTTINFSTVFSLL